MPMAVAFFNSSGVVRTENILMRLPFSVSSGIASGWTELILLLQMSPLWKAFSNVCVLQENDESFRSPVLVKPIDENVAESMRFRCARPC